METSNNEKSHVTLWFSAGVLHYCQSTDATGCCDGRWIDF